MSLADSFVEAVTDGSLLVAAPVAAAAGLVSFLSPCVLPLVPGYLSFVTGLSGEDCLITPGDRPPAPSLSGTTLEGERLDLADYEGKVVVLNFWASWCAPCRAEASNLIEVAEATKASGVQFVGVNVKNARDEAIAFERKAGVPYPSLHDQPGVLLTRFRKLVPQVPPTTLILDRQGRITGRFIGGVTTRELLVPVQAVAAEPA